MSVLVAALVSNASKWLDRFLSCLDRLYYPKRLLHFAFLEGGSLDNTWDTLTKFRDTHNNVLLEGFNLEGDRIHKLAILRNKLIDVSLKDEDYVFFVDSDLAHIPPDTLIRLIKHDLDIIAPYVLIEGRTQFYDTLAFRYRGKQFNHVFPYCEVSPSILSPVEVDKAVSGLTEILKQVGVREGWTERGRKVALEHISRLGLNLKSPFQVDSVGTCYLVKRKVYDAGVRYRDGVSEQVSFCDDARAKGFKVWVDPNISVLHVDLPKHGLRWH